MAGLSWRFWEELVPFGRALIPPAEPPGEMGWYPIWKAPMRQEPRQSDAATSGPMRRFGEGVVPFAKDGVKGEARGPAWRVDVRRRGPKALSEMHLRGEVAARSDAAMAGTGLRFLEGVVPSALGAWAYVLPGCRLRISKGFGPDACAPGGQWKFLAPCHSDGLRSVQNPKSSISVLVAGFSGAGRVAIS